VERSGVARDDRDGKAASSIEQFAPTANSTKIKAIAK
jgi:hypothetical protein